MTCVFEGASTINKGIGEWGVGQVCTMLGIFDGAAAFTVMVLVLDWEVVKLQPTQKDMSRHRVWFVRFLFFY